MTVCNIEVFILDQSLIGCKIRQLRENARLTQKEIGKLRGVSQSTVANQENGTRSLGEDGLFWYANYFGVSADYILGIIDEPHYLRIDKANGAIYLDTQKSPPGEKPEELSVQTSFSTTVPLDDQLRDPRELEQFVRNLVAEAFDKHKKNLK